MKKSVHLTILVMLLLLLAACSVLQEPEAPSGPITAVPVAIEENEAMTESETEIENSDIEKEETAANSSATQIYVISPTGSQVRFELDEDLRGVRKTVVGSTNQVAGEIATNLADLSGTQVGVIQINARTLTTDNNFRNRAINNKILETDTHEFITFAPTAVTGLPDSINPGDSVTFNIVGDLTIRDVTNEVTFEVTATAVSEDEISGTASTVVNRNDYNLIIPSVPNVANVEEEIDLIIDFTATSAT